MLNFCQCPQRKEKKTRDNGSQPDIQTTTLLPSPFLDNKHNMHPEMSALALDLNCPGNWTSTLWVWETDPAKVTALRKTKQTLEKEAVYHIKNKE